MGNSTHKPLVKMLALLGWKIDIEVPVPREGAIIAGAPHTSNWDFIMMLAIAQAAGIDLRWLGKKSLFWFPMGIALRHVGGIPVDRSGSHGLVEQISSIAERNQPFYLGITPEGTRKRTKYWKSGFYRIALAANLPIQLGYVDRKTKTAGLGPVIWPTGDAKIDMDQIRAFYADKEGISGEKKEPARLRAEDSL